MTGWCVNRFSIHQSCMCRKCLQFEVTHFLKCLEFEHKFKSCCYIAPMRLKLASALAPLVASVPLALNLYATWWAVNYRLPPCSECALVDLRKDPHSSVNCVSFCAGLADNPHGFPGHAFVVWSASPNWRRRDSDAIGFVPKEPFASLVRDVPGTMVRPHVESTINPDSLTVIVDDEDFDHSRRLARQWNSASFRTGRRDCVAFTESIAKSLGLSVPERLVEFPQDYIRKLKKLNGKNPTTGGR